MPCASSSPGPSRTRRSTRGGYAWAFLQYVLGFRQLGCEVLYVEHLDAQDCIDGAWQPAPFAASANAAVFAALVARHGLAGSAALLQRDGEALHRPVACARCGVGRRRRPVRQPLRAAFTCATSCARCAGGVYVDLDPGFTQIWQAQYGADMNLRGPRRLRHRRAQPRRGPTARCRRSACRGARSARRSCVQRMATARRASATAYTTVADWRGYAPIEWEGVWYRQKADEFLRLIELPRRTPCALEICLAIHPDEPDLPRLRAHGWRLSEPRVHAADTETYRDYVRALARRVQRRQARLRRRPHRLGERPHASATWRPAGRRSCRIPACGAHLPVGRGAAGLRRASTARPRRSPRSSATTRGHARAAAALAARYFDSDRVLAALLDIAGV